MDLLKRLALRLPDIRALAEENSRLRAEVADLRSEAKHRECELAAARRVFLMSGDRHQ